MGLKSFEDKIRRADQHTLEKGFSQLCEYEVELEAKLAEVKEAKARFIVEIGLRVNKKR